MKHSQVDLGFLLYDWTELIQKGIINQSTKAPPMRLSKSGLADHFWTVPWLVSNQGDSGSKKKKKKKDGKSLSNIVLKWRVGLHFGWSKQWNLMVIEGPDVDQTSVETENKVGGVHLKT